MRKTCLLLQNIRLIIISARHSLFNFNSTFFQTGTLTEDGLDLYSVIPSNVGEKFGRCVVDITALPTRSPLIQALASCHSLTSIQGQLKGDPLDLKMFEFTQWVSFHLFFIGLFL